MYNRSIIRPDASELKRVSGVVSATLALCSVITRAQSRIHGFLVVVIIGESGMNLGGRQVRIVHDDLRCAVAMCDVIRNNIDDPVSGSVYAGTTSSIESDVRINDVFRLVCSHGTLLLRLMIRKLARWLQERKRASQDDYRQRDA